MIVGIIIILFIALCISSWYITRKEVLSDKIDVIYSKMEYHVISNEIVINNAVKDFMSAHKKVYLDKRYADFEVFAAIALLVNESSKIRANKSFDFVKDNHPDLYKFTEDFSEAITKLAKHKLLVNPYLSFMFFKY